MQGRCCRVIMLQVSVQQPQMIQTKGICVQQGGNVCGCKLHSNAILSVQYAILLRCSATCDMPDNCL